MKVLTDVEDSVGFAFRLAIMYHYAKSRKPEAAEFISKLLMLSNAGAAAPRPRVTQCGVTAQFLEEQISSAENFYRKTHVSTSQSATS